MRNYIHFWTATLIRGALALLAGSAIVLVPDMSTTVLFLPFAIAITILCIAGYVILDSAIVFFTSFLVSSERARIAIRLQGTAGTVAGALFLSIFYDRVRLEWFLYPVALQAFCAACSEFVVARHVSLRHGSRWNYATAAIALMGGIAYSIVAFIPRDTLLPGDTTTLIYGYLLAFGTAQCLIAVGMLYADAHIQAGTHAHT